MRGALVRIGVLATGLLIGLPAGTQAQSVPDPRAHHELVYHTGEGRVYLIGGSTRRGEGYHWFDDVWAWDGTGWRAQAPLPFPRSSHRVVYVPQRRSLVLFGGQFERALRAEGVVWRRGEGGWRAVGGHAAAGRDEPGLCHDPERGRTVMFGGWDADAAYRGETWEWDGERLELVDSAGPRARAGHAFVYDPVRGGCLLFGGRDDDGYLGDTWTWNGERWQRLDVEGPEARWFAGAAADPVGGRIVLFAGRGTTGDLGDTWTWNGQSWRRLHGAGPPARSMAKLAPTGTGVLLFGGRVADAAGFHDLGDTWELRGGTWSERSTAGRGPIR